MDRIEQQIVTPIIQRALAKGYMVSVDTDGEDYDLYCSTSEQEIFETIFACDYAKVLFHDVRFNRRGFILFIYGNGEDVVSDYSDNDEMEALINP
jgi:hypothetical protein